MRDLILLKISIQDYFTKEMLQLLVFPLIGTFVVLIISFYSIADIGLSQLENTKIEIQKQQVLIENNTAIETKSDETYTGSAIIDFLLRYSITSWIVTFLFYLFGLFVIGYLSIFISLIIVGFLTPYILRTIHKRHYSSLILDEGYDTILGSFVKLLKTALVMIFLFIILIPFYFIPIINIFAINLPIYYFFHKMLNYDVSANIMKKESFQRIYYFNKNTFRRRTLFLYIISLIPLVAFFISIFYIIYIGHSYLILLEENREN